MKKLYFTLLFTAVAVLFFTSEVFTNASGPGAGVAGLPGGATCATSCHPGTLNSGPGTPSITTDIPVSGYVPGSTYTVTAKIIETGRSKFGFQAFPGYDVDMMSQVGSVSGVPGTAKIVSNSDGDHVTHNSSGTSGTDSLSWTFNWVAPVSGAGDVAFYAAFNAANSNGTATGDNIYTASVTVTEVATSVASRIERGLKVYPTLFDDSFKVEAEFDYLNELEVKVFDLSGKEVFSRTDWANGASIDWEIDTQNWESGIYMIRFDGLEAPYTLKAVKM